MKFTQLNEVNNGEFKGHALGCISRVNGVYLRRIRDNKRHERARGSDEARNKRLTAGKFTLEQGD